MPRVSTRGRHLFWIWFNNPGLPIRILLFHEDNSKICPGCWSRWLESLPMRLFHSHMYCGTQNTIKKVVGPCFSLRLDHYLEYNYIKMESQVPDPHKSSNNRVSFETSFDSKQPKMEPKLVSAWSETNVCFGCFSFIPKQRVSVFRLNQNKQKNNWNSVIESIFWYFLSENLGLFWFFSVCFGLFRNSLFRLFHFFYRNREFRCFDWTETNRWPTKTVW